MIIVAHDHGLILYSLSTGHFWPLLKNQAGLRSPSLLQLFLTWLCPTFDLIVGDDDILLTVLPSALTHVQNHSIFWKILHNLHWLFFFFGCCEPHLSYWTAWLCSSFLNRQSRGFHTSYQYSKGSLKASDKLFRVEQFRIPCKRIQLHPHHQ